MSFNFSIAAGFLATGFSGLFCQLFLVHRILRLTENWIFPVVLAAFSLTGFGGSVYATVTLLTHCDYAQRTANVKPVTIWLMSSAIADAAIAVILASFVWRARRVVNQFDGSQLYGPITRALHQTLECGGVVTAAAMSSLGVYIHDNSTNISVSIGFILGESPLLDR